MTRPIVVQSTGAHAIPACPVCHATGRRCRRPSGHDAAEWHVEREDALARQCRCPECCQRWLARRDAAAAQQEFAL